MTDRLLTSTPCSSRPHRCGPRPTRAARAVRATRAAAAAAALWLAASAALAHDTWFAPYAGAPASERLLALGTGNQFPLLDSPIGTEFLPQQGCALADGGRVAMAALRYDAAALVLRPPPRARSCWVQSTPFDVVLPADKIPVYLNEVRPPPAMLAAWADMRARGLPWQERYVKHARVELPGTGGAAQAAEPSGLGMDMLLAGERRPLKVGDTVTVQVLRDGEPLADFAVEWRNDRGRIGLWQKTDAQGRVSQRLPLPGQWLLRGVDLRLSATVPDTFDSRFITLALTVEAR
jgi:hypothetical protein